MTSDYNGQDPSGKRRLAGWHGLGLPGPERERLSAKLIRNRSLIKEGTIDVPKRALSWTKI